MERKNFIKKIENFYCGHCNAKITGNGYTNHCPKCLWSKHVDIIPGDRASDCGGLMKPLEIGKKHGEFIILHKCVECGYIKKNVASLDDDFNQLIKLSIGG